MNNERDELLDDLFSYYDSPDATDGDTTVIPTLKPSEPQEESLGDTLIMNLNSKPEPEPQLADETMVINTPEPQIAEIPQDEVFGNLDLSGHIIEKPEEPIRRQRIDTPTPKYVQYREEIVPIRKTGAWHTLKPLWATLIVCVALVFSYLFYVTDTGIVGIYKSNFSYNFSLIMRVFGIDYNPAGEMPVIGSNNFFSITAHAEEAVDSPTDVPYNTLSEVKASIPFSEADTAAFKKYDKGVVCAKSNYMCYVSKNGEKKWEHETQISNPILSVSGKYIAVAGKDSTHLNLYKGKKLLYAIDIPDRIKTCSVSEKGDVALITDKTAYKGAVSVFNKKGEEVFSWISGVNYITAVSMLKSRNVAVSLVSTENNVKSYVMMFDIYSTDPINGTEITDSLIFESSHHKNNAYVCADNSISSVNSDGELNYTVRFDNMDITHTAAGSKGWRAVSYTDSNLPYINVYNRSGKLYAVTTTESIPDYIDVYKSTVLYNNGRDVLCGESDSIKTRYTAPMTVKNLILINRSTYMIVYENSLEIIKL